MGKRAYLGLISLVFVLVSISAAFAQVPAAVADVGDLFANNILAIGFFAFFIALIDGYIIGMLRARGVPVRAEVHYAIMGVLIIVFILSLLSSFAGVELPPFVGTFSFAIVVIALIPTGWDGAQVAGLRAMERSPAELSIEELRAEAYRAQKLGDTKRGSLLLQMARDIEKGKGDLDKAKKEAEKEGDSEKLRKIIDAERALMQQARSVATVGQMTEAAHDAGAGKPAIVQAERALETEAVREAVEAGTIERELEQAGLQEEKEDKEKLATITDPKERAELVKKMEEIEKGEGYLKAAERVETDLWAKEKTLPSMERTEFKEEQRKEEKTTGEEEKRKRKQAEGEEAKARKDESLE